MKRNVARAVLGLMALLVPASCMSGGHEEAQDPSAQPSSVATGQDPTDPTDPTSAPSSSIDQPVLSGTGWEVSASDQSYDRFRVKGYRMLLNRPEKVGRVTFVDERGQDVGELRFARSSDNKQRVTLSYRGQQIYDVSDTKKTFFGGKVRADLTAEETDLLKSLQQGLVADSVANLAQPETPEVLYATAPGTCRGPCFACSLSVVATPGFPIDELAFCIACFICLGV